LYIIYIKCNAYNSNKTWHICIIYVEENSETENKYTTYRSESVAIITVTETAKFVINLKAAYNFSYFFSHVGCYEIRGFGYRKEHK
jgi:hypothetical protein